MAHQCENNSVVAKKAFVVAGNRWCGIVTNDTRHLRIILD
jgi:hypothetical protein